MWAERGGSASDKCSGGDGRADSVFRWKGVQPCVDTLHAFYQHACGDCFKGCGCDGGPNMIFESSYMPFGTRDVFVGGCSI